RIRHESTHLRDVLGRLPVHRPVQAPLGGRTIRQRRRHANARIPQRRIQARIVVGILGVVELLLLDQPGPAQTVVQSTHVQAEHLFHVDRIVGREVQTARGALGVVDRAFDVTADRIAAGRANPKRDIRIVAEDERASSLIERRPVDAVFSQRLRRHGGDDVGQFDLVIVENEAEVRNEARLEHDREGERVGLFGFQIRVPATHARDAGRGVKATEIVGGARRVTGEVERETLLSGQSGTVLDPVRTILGVRGGIDIGRGAGIVRTKERERLRKRTIHFRQGRSAQRGIEARLEGDVLDGTIDEVDAIDVTRADMAVIEVTVRTAQLGKLAKEAVAEQGDRDFAEDLVALVFHRLLIRTAVQEQQTVTELTIAARAFGEFTPMLGADGHADAASAPEVPQLARERAQQLLLLITIGRADFSVEVVQSFLALLANTEDIQRLALLDCSATGFGAANVTATHQVAELSHRDALLGEQGRAADNTARRAEQARRVTHGVRRERHALDIDAAFTVCDLDLAVGVADVPATVLDEQEVVEAPFHRGHITRQIARVELAAIRAAQRRAGVGSRRSAEQLTRFRSGGLRIDVDPVVEDRLPQIFRDEGVVAQTNVEGAGRADGRQPVSGRAV